MIHPLIVLLHLSPCELHLSPCEQGHINQTFTKISPTSSSGKVYDFCN